MRVFSSSMGLGAVLIVGLSCGAWAQDQPAAGSPPPGAAAQTAAQPQAAPAQAQPAPEQNAAPAQNDAMPPPPPDGRRGPNPRRQARMLARRLGLTPAQQAEIEPILADHQQRMRRARTDATLTPQDRRARVREINHDSARRINAVLTPAQRQEFKQLKQEQRARRLEREQQQPPAPASNPQ